MTIVIHEMNEQDLQDLMVEHELGANVLDFRDADALWDFRYHAAEGMVRFGGSFMSALGHALMHSDLKNTIKIMTQWKYECLEHAELHRKFIKQRDKPRMDD
jgi:hypothetical protein